MLQKRFGEKVYKITLNGACPVRTETVQLGSAAVSSAVPEFRGLRCGSFAVGFRADRVSRWQLIQKKRPVQKFIAYFQHTRTLCTHLLSAAALSGSDPASRRGSPQYRYRPDCLGDDVLALLSELNTIKPVWVELDFRRSTADTAAYIRRGYPLSTLKPPYRNYMRAISRSSSTRSRASGRISERMLATIDYLNTSRSGNQIAAASRIKGTDLADDYLAGKFQTLSREEYLDLLISCLEHLSPDLVIHRCDR